MHLYVDLQTNWEEVQFSSHRVPSEESTKFSGQEQIRPPPGLSRHSVGQPPLFSHGLGVTKYI